VTTTPVSSEVGSSVFSIPSTRQRSLLLIVDPDDTVAGIAEQIRAYDIDVVVCPDPVEALVRAGSLRPDAVLAAANLRPLDSATIVQVLTKRSGIPVVLGVGDDDGQFAAAALAAGAAACVARPYRPQEVLPILRAIRPDDVITEPPLEVGGLRLDPAALQVSLHGRSVRLPMREFRLLHLLMANAERVVTRERIRAEIWSSSTADTSNTVTVHIQRLRHRLGDDPTHPSIIQTVRGVGYRLDPPPVARARIASSKRAAR
jgi:DNA-binding response OmpR family regulator